MKPRTMEGESDPVVEEAGGSQIEITPIKNRLTKSHDLASIDKFKPLDEESLNLLQPELKLLGEMLQASLSEPSNSLLPKALWGVDLFGPLDGSTPLLQLLFVFFRGNPSILKSHELLLRHLRYRVEVSLPPPLLNARNPLLTSPPPHLHTTPTAPPPHETCPWPG
jgi:hypothetical protein